MSVSDRASYTSYLGFTMKYVAEVDRHCYSLTTLVIHFSVLYVYMHVHAYHLLVVDSDSVFKELVGSHNNYVIITTVDA